MNLLTEKRTAPKLETYHFKDFETTFPLSDFFSDDRVTEKWPFRRVRLHKSEPFVLFLGDDRFFIYECKVSGEDFLIRLVDYGKTYTYPRQIIVSVALPIVLSGKTVACPVETDANLIEFHNAEVKYVSPEMNWHFDVHRSLMLHYSVSRKPSTDFLQIRESQLRRIHGELKLAQAVFDKFDIRIDCVQRFKIDRRSLTVEGLRGFRISDLEIPNELYKRNDDGDFPDDQDSSIYIDDFDQINEKLNSLLNNVFKQPHLYRSPKEYLETLIFNEYSLRKNVFLDE